MPFYHKLGQIPHKRHTQFKKPDGKLYREELMGLERCDPQRGARSKEHGLFLSQCTSLRNVVRSRGKWHIENTVWQPAISFRRLHCHPLWNNVANAPGFKGSALLYDRESFPDRAAQALSQRLRPNARARALFRARHPRAVGVGNTYRARSFRGPHKGARPINTPRV